MPIDYGQLKPIASMGQPVPIAQSPNGLNEFGSGIMQGLLQGQQGALNAQQMKMNSMQMEAAKQAGADQQTIRKAGASGDIDAIYKAYMSINPKLANEFAKGRQDVINAIITGQGMIKDQNAKQLENTAKQMGTVGQLSFGLLAVPDDQLAKQVEYALPVINKLMPNADISPNMPVPQLRAIIRGWAGSSVHLVDQIKSNPQSAALLVPEGQGQDQVRDQIAGNVSDPNATSGQKDLRRIAQLSTKQNLTPQEQIELDGLKANQAARSRGMTTNPYDSALAQQDAKLAADASTLRGNMETFHIDAENALKEIPKIPEFALGPIAKGLKIDKLSPAAQKVIGPLNAMALQLKEYYKLGSGQGFTDADRDFLTEIAGNTGYYKRPLTEIVNRMDRIASAARYNAWSKENKIRKQSSNYDQWLSDNPEPSKTWETKSSSSFQEGQTYQDSNGNKAQYLNGKWVEVK